MITCSGCRSSEYTGQFIICYFSHCFFIADQTKGLPYINEWKFHIRYIGIFKFDREQTPLIGFHINQSFFQLQGKMASFPQ